MHLGSPGLLAVLRNVLSLSVWARWAKVSTACGSKAVGAKHSPQPASICEHLSSPQGRAEGRTRQECSPSHSSRAAFGSSSLSLLSSPLLHAWLLFISGANGFQESWGGLGKTHWPAQIVKSLPKGMQNAQEHWLPWRFSHLDGKMGSGSNHFPQLLPLDPVSASCSLSRMP